MRVLLSTVVLALALVAAGCGGDDEEADATASWASGFCTAVTDWTNSLGDVTSQFTDTSNLSEAGLQSAADDTRSATEELIDELRGLGTPDTESGDEIKSSLDELATTLESEADKIGDAVEGVSGITGIASAITTVSTSLSAMGSAFASTLQTVEAADVGGELQSALEDSPECAGISNG